MCLLRHVKKLHFIFRSKKKMQALSNCFGGSTHVSKVDASKHSSHKPEEKKVVEPIKIKKPVEPELVEPIKIKKSVEPEMVEPVKSKKQVNPVPANAPPSPKGLKLKICLKNSSVSTPEPDSKSAKKSAKKPAAKTPVQPIQQPILGKLVVRKNKKLPASKSILFPPVPPAARETLTNPEPEKKSPINPKKKAQKVVPETPKTEEARKVPKLVIKRDAIVPTSVSRKTNVQTKNIPSKSPSAVSVDVPTSSTPPTLATPTRKRCIKILPLKLPFSEIESETPSSGKDRIRKKKSTDAKPDSLSGYNVIKLFYLSLMKRLNKLECCLWRTILA
jgi:hypothetical protein